MSRDVANTRVVVAKMRLHRLWDGNEKWGVEGQLNRGAVLSDESYGVIASDIL